ncbi:7854_t:CDS:2 [Entrophospora sp. SA101]|nr:2508_t:CDS:2 [Entrophospora sp. SA101]CAJ0625283.1 7854_t:CDS:2 [Entrophospora sp. SA101]CAJ0837162.1 14051_t:CDS:2 [Entrophospora sp. SA101]CAJ0866151.1 14447_t:CDS:2 [Entrophospora sp. SA101]
MSSPSRQFELEEFRKRTLRLMEAFVYDFMKKNDCEDSARTYYNEKNLENWPPPWLAHNFPNGPASNNINKNTNTTTVSDNYTPSLPYVNTRINNNGCLKTSDLDDLFGLNLKSGFSEHENQQYLDDNNDIKMEEEKDLLNIKCEFDSDNNNNENSDDGNVDVRQLYFSTSSPSISSSTSPTLTSSAPLSRTRIMNMDHNQNQQNIDHDDKFSPQQKDSNKGQGRNHQDNDSPLTNYKQLPDLSLPLDVPEGFLTEWFLTFWEAYKSTHESIVGKHI